MHERRPGHPHDVAAAVALIDEQSREVHVVDGLFSRHLARHELELAIVVATSCLGVHEDAFAPIFPLADRHEIADADAAHLADPQIAVATQDERRIHARLARESPLPANADVGREVRRREEVLGQHAVGRRWDETRIGSGREARLAKIGMRNHRHRAKDGYLTGGRPTPCGARA